MTDIPRRLLRILITAGPTREPIDKVRFISNPSTGRMGYEIAHAALARGHRVTLISGPTSILPPKGAEFVLAETAIKMRDKVRRFFRHCDCLIMAAAVSDFRPQRLGREKIKKEEHKQSFALKLTKNPDILLEAGRKKGKRILVGFALETAGLVKNAKEKLKKKNLDLIVANQLNQKNLPFGDGGVKATLISREGKMENFTFLAKSKLAIKLLKKIERISGAMAE